MFRTLSRGALLAVPFLFVAALAQAQQYAAIVMDARTGKVIQATNADTRLHPASLTKMMTLYIVFDEIRRGRLSLDQKVTISANAAAEPPSRLGLRAGQQIELRYLIRAAAIKSANDAATALGEAVAGSEPAFAARMNAYAKAMGLTNTSFKNANGLTEAGHLSSARDMAVIGRRLVYDFPQYYNIFGRASTSAGVQTVQNTNKRLLDAYPGADGIKTGYTRAAGFNLVSSAQRGDKRVIVALLGGRTSAARNAEVTRLMDVGFAKMPARARIAALPPVQVTTAVAAAAPERVAPSAGTATLAALPPTAAAATAVGNGRAIVVAGDLRPRPRSAAGGNPDVARSQASIAVAIAEVNAELAVTRSSRSPALAGLIGRPAPRPESSRTVAAIPAPATAGSASTFAVAPRPPRASPAPEQTIEVANAGAGTTGGNDWGIQLGAFRAKGDAERELLTTALMDVPGLTGGLRRVEAAKLQGVTVYRAQFVGLSRSEALGACEALSARQTDCLPLAPGI